MPLVQYACPETAPTYGESHTPEFCLLKCENRCISPLLLAALTDSNFKDHHVGAYISATSLEGCVRKLVLERTVPYAEEPGKLLYAFRGTIAHEVVESASSRPIFMGKTKSLADFGFLSEWNMKIGFCFEHGGFPIGEDVDPVHGHEKITCPGCKRGRKKKSEREVFILSGTLDLSEPLWREFDKESGILPVVIHDLKTMKQYAVEKFITGEDSNTYHPHVKDEHFYQLHVYKYLASISPLPEALVEKGVREIVPVEARIQAFSMGKFPYTGSPYKHRKHYKHAWSHWDIPPIDFMETVWIENYIREKARARYDALILGKEPTAIVESTSGKEHSWLCDYCAFFKTQYCPNPNAEWKALKDGKSREEAFQIAVEAE